MGCFFFFKGTKGDGIRMGLGGEEGIGLLLGCELNK